MRHIMAILDGEDLDQESGAPHQAHVAACMAIILDAAEVGNLVDDRPLAGTASDLMRHYTQV